MDSEEPGVSLVDEFYCGVLKGRHGKTRILFGNALQDAREKAPKRLPKPPRIQGILRQAHEFRARLAADLSLTREALAKESGINPGHLTRLLRLADLDPEIQQHILAMPPSIYRSVVTERRLRLIAKIADQREQVARFQTLLLSPVKNRKKPRPLMPAPSQPFAIPAQS